MRKLVWMSYDLGIRGDYESLYAWLDEHDAKECGDSVACFYYEYKDNVAEELKHDLEETIDVTKKTRVYLIFFDSQKGKGEFLFGNRRSSPWVGYAEEESEADEEE
jgi:hypothetical protein